MSENIVFNNIESKDNSTGIDFKLPKTNNSIIKVIGVGGGGGNAVNHMYREGIKDVTYLMCNTDKQALDASPVPSHLQLGKDGLGAGNRPEKGKKSAMESLEDIRQVLQDGTKMVFITAGMGGGTGTGAAPVIAQCAKESGILTVGIVTIPFKFEGLKKINTAIVGIEELAKNVDALLVVNNERLREIYPDLTVLNAFAKADDTLNIAARSIAEIIMTHGRMNLDFEDVTTVLKDGGVAIMSIGYGEGDNRVTKAIEEALNSPLINNRDVFDSKKVLLKIDFSSEDDATSLKMEEMNEVTEFMSKFSEDVETKWGLTTDNTLGEKVKITLLASGFGLPGRFSGENDVTEDYYPITTKEPIRRYSVFLFDDSELDDEEIISLVDTTPTYKRNRDTIKHKKQANSAQRSPK